MATTLNASKLSNAHLINNEEPLQIETLFSIEVFVHSLNEVVGLEYLDCTNPAIGFRLLDYPLEYVEQHPDYRQQYLNYRKSIQDNQHFRNDVYLNYINFGRGKSCLFAINPDKLFQILEDPRSHILELYLVDLQHTQQVSSVNTSQPINSIKKCRVIGTVDKIRIQTDDIGTPQQCDVGVRDIQDGSLIGRLRLTFKLVCIGLSKLPKQVSLPQTVKPPLQTVPNSNLNSNTPQPYSPATTTAPNHNSPKPSKTPTKTTTPKDQNLRTHHLRNHHCEVCIPEEMRKDLHEGGKKFWDQLFTEILRDASNTQPRSPSKPSLPSKTTPSKTKASSPSLSATHQPSKKNPKQRPKQSPVVMKQHMEGTKTHRVPTTPRNNIHIEVPREESSMEYSSPEHKPSAVYYHNPPETKPPQPPVFLIHELPKPIYPNRQQPVEMASSQTRPMQAPLLEGGSVLGKVTPEEFSFCQEMLIQELLPILQAKHAAQQQTNSTSSVRSDQQTTEAPVVPEFEESREQPSFSEIKIQPRSAEPIISHETPSRLQSESVMVQTTPQQTPRPEIPLLSLIPSKEEKQKKMKTVLEESATQTEKMISPRTQKTISNRLLENEIRKMTKLKEGKPTRTHSTSPAKKKKTASKEKKKISSKKEVIPLEKEILMKRSHQVVTPYNTSPRKLELLAKVHAIQMNIHSAKKKEDRKKLGYQDEEEKFFPSPSKTVQNAIVAPSKESEVTMQIQNQPAAVKMEDQLVKGEAKIETGSSEAKSVEVRPVEPAAVVPQAVPVVPLPSQPKLEESKQDALMDDYEESFEEPESVDTPRSQSNSSSASSSESQSEDSSEEEEEEDESEKEDDDDESDVGCVAQPANDVDKQF